MQNYTATRDSVKKAEVLEPVGTDSRTVKGKESITEAGLEEAIRNLMAQKRWSYEEAKEAMLNIYSVED